MTWIVRRMAAGDIDAVLALAEKVSEAPRWSREDYSSCIDSCESGLLLRAGFAAEADGRLLGFSVGKLVARTCELESIAVEPGSQGKGMGRALFEAVIDWAQTHGATRIELEVRASNTRAIMLYELAGLRREGLRTGYYKSPEEDAVLMGRALGAGGKLA